ncbi:MAG: hypothetical protein H6811_06470 [Phycisphaeraceae bacterium]|nr:hypothetical protein [Phycisphaeraceae bacterium]
MTSRTTFRSGFVASLVAAVLCSGCGKLTFTPWSPGGTLASIDSYTYPSGPYQPATVTLVDTRTGEVVWSTDVPVGKQLSMRFAEGKGNDDQFTPDLLRWAIQDGGTETGSLRNSQPVPGPDARRVDYTLRDAPEFPR